MTAARRRPLVFTTVALLGLTALAPAQFPVLTGDIEWKVPPPSTLAANQHTSTEHISLIAEQADFIVPTAAQYPAGPIYVDLDVRLLPAGSPYDLVSGSQLLGVQERALESGELLDVWIVHLDKPAGHQGFVTLEGAVDFGAEVVAVQVRKRQLDDHDGELGAAGISAYPNASKRGLELGTAVTRDRLTISSNHQRLDIHLSVNSNLDELRVFTRPYVPAIQTYCFGESGCPCSNDAPSGSGRGCANSESPGGLLSPQGTNVAASDDLSLSLTGLPRNTFGLLFMGEGQSANPVAFGEGRLCVQPGPNGAVWGQGYKRIAVGATGMQGAFTVANIVSRANQTHGGGTIAAGTTWHFQGFYRDTSMTGCAQLAGYNLTNALRIDFE